MMIRRLSAYASMLLIVAGCAKPAPPPPPTPMATSDTSERSFDEAVVVATDGLLAQLLQQRPPPSTKPEAKRGVVIDPMVDATSGQQTGATRLFEMGGDIRHIDEHAVDDVWHRRPFPSLVTLLAMPLGPVVVGARRGQHDESPARLHLAVAEASVGAGHPRPLLEPEGAGQPVHGCGPILIGDHRNDIGVARHLVSLPQAISGGRYSPHTLRSTTQHSPMVT